MRMRRMFPSLSSPFSLSRSASPSALIDSHHVVSPIGLPDISIRESPPQGAGERKTEDGRLKTKDGRRTTDDGHTVLDTVRGRSHSARDHIMAIVNVED